MAEKQLYKYQGQTYRLSETDPVKAREKIKAHLASKGSEAPTETEDTDSSGFTSGDLKEAAIGTAKGIGKGIYGLGKGIYETAKLALPTKEHPLPGGAGAEALAGIISSIPDIYRRKGQIYEAGKEAVKRGVEEYKTAPVREKFEKPFEVGTELAGMVYGPGGLSKLSNVLRTKFGGDVNALADALKAATNARTSQQIKDAETVAKKADEEAKRLEKLSAQQVASEKERVGLAERTATEAGKVSERQAKKAEAEYGKLPGVRTVEEAGEYRGIPETRESIGTRLKSYASDTLKRFSESRKTRGNKNAAASWDAAANIEANGGRVASTSGFNEAVAELDRAISETPVSSARQQLIKLKDDLTGKKLIEGTVVGDDLTFKQMEYFRRFMKDRASGLPAEGFDAIDQQLAGRVASKIEKGMEQFMENTGKNNVNQFRKFLDEWRADTEKLISYRTKIGKALVGEEAKAAGYASVPAADIPSRVFKNRDSFETLVDALGGNRQLAEAEARKHFVSEMEKFAGNPEKIKSFIRDNRSMLEHTNSKEMVERFLSETSKQTARGEAAATRSAAEQAKTKESGTEAKANAAEAEKARSSQEAALKRQREYGKMREIMQNAKTPEEVVRSHNQIISKLYEDGVIDAKTFGELDREGRKVLTQARTAQAARGLLKTAGVSIGAVKGYEFFTGDR